jgi:hypothetical protein
MLPLDGIHSAVRQADLYLRTSRHGIISPPLYEDVGAYVADDVVPRVLHHELMCELDALAGQQPKDFHPGTDGKVQDIIHPSLCKFTVTFLLGYCLIYLRSLHGRPYTCESGGRQTTN